MATRSTTHPAPSHPLAAADPRLRAAGRAIRVLGRLAPGAGARAAEALFVRTARPAPRPHEAAFLRGAVHGAVVVAGQRIATYRWGEHGPLLLCTHGWWSHAGRFAPLGTAALAAGFRVVAFDAPGHGRSSGWRATMPEFARALRAVADDVGPVDALVGHSLGGAASIFALAHGLEARRAVVLAAPADLEVWVERFRDAVALPDPLYARMRANLEARLGLTWDALQVERHAARLALPGLVIHDHDDTDVPVQEGERLAAEWRQATLHRTRGLGHRAILRDPDVVRRVMEFLG